MLFSSMGTCQSGSLCNHRQNKVTPYLLAIRAVTHLLKGLMAPCSVATEQLLVLSELKSYRFGHPTLLGPVSSWETNYSLPSASSQASSYNGCVCGIVRLWASGQALVFPVPANEPNKISFVLCSIPSAQRTASCVANHSLYLPTAAAGTVPESPAVSWDTQASVAILEQEQMWPTPSQPSCWIFTGSSVIRCPSPLMGKVCPGHLLPMPMISFHGGGTFFSMRHFLSPTLFFF